MLTSEKVHQTDSRASITVLFYLEDPEQYRALLLHQAAFRGSSAIERLDENRRFVALHLFPGGALKVAS